MILPPGHYGLVAAYADIFLSEAAANGSYRITWAALNDGIDDPEKPDQLDDFFIVDIRSPSAFNTRHIPGAVNIPYAEFAKPWHLESLPTDQPILVVCGSGALSNQVAAILGMLGYGVRSLDGGMAVVP